VLLDPPRGAVSVTSETLGMDEERASADAAGIDYCHRQRKRACAGVGHDSRISSGAVACRMSGADARSSSIPSVSLVTETAPLGGSRSTALAVDH
jgi:hypothetical protein